MLQIKNLAMHFEDGMNPEEVVHHISFEINQGEILGIVGESGSGKTIVALTIAGLGKAGLTIDSGEIRLEDRNLLALTAKEWRQVQGKQIGMIFQEPMTSLNPTMKIGDQVEEALIIHTRLNRAERRKKVMEALLDVELDQPEELLGKYPHELSGGMRQRVMIASAIICRPKILIADEPTTALDVQTQNAILDLLKKLNEKYQMSILFISHNLRVVYQICQRVLVMKEGNIVEEGLTEEVFNHPTHDYTKELIRAIPIRSKISFS